jgi:lipopolysaccharide export system protein LptC
MTLPRWLPAVLLLLAASASGWLLWKLREPETGPPLYGPPRSDYVLLDFELMALDENGAESFRINGPMLARHPHLATLDVQQPRFLFPDADGKPWNARADQAWVSKDGDELRLDGAVAFDGPPDDADGRVALRTDSLTVLPEVDAVRTESIVTVTSPGSILRGRGLRADLKARRFELLAEVTARYAPPKR